jgi:hypothetical protein
MNRKTLPSTIGLLAMAMGILAALLPLSPVQIVAAESPTVAIVGSLQSELGCAGDWQPECAETELVYDAADDVYQRVFTVPTGSWEYKAALNDSWDVNYGANATHNGDNIPLNLTEDKSVKFYYDHKTHWITDNVNKIIATVPGSFQSELGCPGDWQPDCLRSWLQDPDGDGIYSFSTTAIPAGDYEGKVAHNESWDENYGVGGVPNGDNYGFNVPANATVTFSYDATTHILTIDAAVPPPVTVNIPGSLQSELGCAGDWDPACEQTYLEYDAADDVYQRTFTFRPELGIQSGAERQLGCQLWRQRHAEWPEHPIEPGPRQERQILL